MTVPSIMQTSPQGHGEAGDGRTFQFGALVDVVGRLAETGLFLSRQLMALTNKQQSLPGA